VYAEAGLAQRRSGFGWFTEMGQLSEDAVRREKYYLAIQATFLPSWPTKYSELKNWLKFRKMIVINPEAKKAVVGVIGEIGPNDWMQHQFGGSPELIREGQIWHSQSNGRVLVFFINDIDQKVPLGIKDLTYKR
jgi:hypothetical protein